MTSKRRPGEVRDAILEVLVSRPAGASVKEIEQQVCEKIGGVAPSSVRSYRRLNTPGYFIRTDRAQYVLDEDLLRFARKVTAKTRQPRSHSHGGVTLFLDDCLNWLRDRDPQSIHAVVTDPPYGLIEYSDEQQDKLRSG